MENTAAAARVSAVCSTNPNTRFLCQACTEIAAAIYFEIGPLAQYREAIVLAGECGKLIDLNQAEILAKAAAALWWES